MWTYLRKCSRVHVLTNVLFGYTLADLGGDESARSKAIADIKFTYVVACQLYGMHKASKDSRERGLYENILNLMLT